ncbi:MAG: hypothetical protein H7246_06450 [Phycisphaerae bacterium]|nr:hypothetical protein [Saprospiraceae bacterium]
MEYLSKETLEWLTERDDLGFAKYFVDLGVDEDDINYRKASIEIASQWCILRKSGKDGKALHPRIQNLIAPHVPSEDGFDAIEWFWSEMCANCATYRFAQIDQFDLTCALYGIYRTLLPKERDVEPFDQIILEKLAEAKGVDLSTATEFSYGIRTNGMTSEVVLPAPEGARTWTEYADQRRIVLINRDRS